MTRAVAGISGFRWNRPTGSRPWLFGIARRVAADHHRRAGSAQRWSRAVAAPASHSRLMSPRSPTTTPPFGRLQPSSADDREILELRIVAGLSPEQTAALLGKRPGRFAPRNRGRWPAYASDWDRRRPTSNSAKRLPNTSVLPSSHRCADSTATSAGRICTGRSRPRCAAGAVWPAPESGVCAVAARLAAACIAMSPSPRRSRGTATVDDGHPDIACGRRGREHQALEPSSTTATSRRDDESARCASPSPPCQRVASIREEIEELLDRAETFLEETGDNDAPAADHRRLPQSRRSRRDAEPDDTSSPCRSAKKKALHRTSGRRTAGRSAGPAS